jgi:hypothetical protein
LQLTIEDCEISNVGGSGIYAIATGGTVRVKDTVLRNNQQSGVHASGTIVAALDHVHAYHNYPSGVDAYGGARVTVSDSVLAHSVAGVHAVSNFGVTSVTVTRSVVTGCMVGLWADTFAGGTARIVADANVLDQVDKAYLWEQGGGTEIIFSPGNNTVAFNNGNISGGTLASLRVRFERGHSRRSSRVPPSETPASIAGVVKNGSRAWRRQGLGTVQAESAVEGVGDEAVVAARYDRSRGHHIERAHVADDGTVSDT